MRLLMRWERLYNNVGATNCISAERCHRGGVSPTVSVECRALYECRVKSAEFRLIFAMAKIFIELKKGQIWNLSLQYNLVIYIRGRGNPSPTAYPTLHAALYLSS